MMLTRILFLPVHIVLLAAGLIAGSKTPPRFQIVYPLLHTAIFFAFWYFVPPSDAPSDFFFVCAGVEAILRSLSLHLLANPWKTFYRLNQPSFDQLSLYGKINWAVNIFFHTRGIGWSWQLPYLPPALPYKTRISYTFYAVRRLLLAFLLADLARSYQALYIPWIATTGNSGIRLGELPFLQKAMAFATCSVNAIASQLMPYECICLVFMMCGADLESFNRPTLGEWREAYTIKRFWGRFWHQNLRWSRQTQARYLAYNILGARKGSRLSGYTQVFYAFFWTGVSHWAGLYMIDPARNWARTFWFFPLQGLGIVFEELVIAGAKRLGVGIRKGTDGKDVATGWAQLLGRAWTLTWFFVTVWGFLEDAIRFGLSNEEGSFTVVRGLLGKGWWV